MNTRPSTTPNGARHRNSWTNATDSNWFLTCLNAGRDAAARGEDPAAWYDNAFSRPKATCYCDRCTASREAANRLRHHLALGEASNTQPFYG